MDLSEEEREEGRKPRKVLPDTAVTPAINPNILQLENKRKAVLAHEIGAGAPCLICSAQICHTGLDLHFWRKICKTCKCKKEDHDFHDDSELDPGRIVIGRLFPPSHPQHQDFQLFEGKTLKPTLVESQNKIPPSVPAKLSNVRNAVKTLEISDKPPYTNGMGESENKRGKIGGDSKEKKVYDWVPPNAAPNVVRKYMEQIPEEERPIKGTEGARKRIKAFAEQFPLYDCDPDQINRPMTEEEEDAMQRYLNYCQKEVVGQGRVSVHDPWPFPIGPEGRISLPGKDGKRGSGGEPEWWPPPPTEAELSSSNSFLSSEEESKSLADKKMAGSSIGGEGPNSCRLCEETFADGEVLVTTQHSGPDTCWHPSCFRCSVCEKVLVDMLYFFRNDKFYCGRHFGDTMFPRCFGCDELIFAAQFTRAEEHDWHLNHFCCYGCDTELGGHKYMARDENPYCIPCYLSNFARVCNACNNKIGPDVKRISHKDLHWHATDECFRCVQCLAVLLGKRFMIKHNHTFCDSNCKNAFFADSQSQQSGSDAGRS